MWSYFTSFFSSAIPGTPTPIDPWGYLCSFPITWTPPPPNLGKRISKEIPPYFGNWLPLAIIKNTHFPGFLGKSSRDYGRKIPLFRENGNTHAASGWGGGGAAILTTKKCVVIGLKLVIWLVGWNVTAETNTLLKPKRHSLRCHGFMVHALLLRMRTNIVYFRVMRRLYCREWNWLCVNQHPWQRTRDHGVWRMNDFNSVL